MSGDYYDEITDEEEEVITINFKTPTSPDKPNKFLYKFKWVHTLSRKLRRIIKIIKE